MKIVFKLVLLLSLACCSQAFAAPDFELRDVEGKPYALSDFKGEPVILHFWASWCPYCKKLQPALEEIHRQHPEIRVFGVNFREFKSVNPQQELASRGHSFTTLVAGEEVAKLYKVRGTPTTFFIDKSGQVVLRTSQSEPANADIQKAVEALSQR